MITTIIILSGVLIFATSFYVWLSDDIPFKKILFPIVLSILLIVIARLLPVAPSHLEPYGKKTDVVIKVPDGFVANSYQIRSNSKWFWTENNDKIIYIIERK